MPRSLNHESEQEPNKWVYTSIHLPLWAMKGTTEVREKPLLARDKNTLHAKQRPPKLTRSVAAYSILKHHNLNHHYYYYRTISKIISGILTMVYSAVNHRYDSKRTIKIISGIVTIIYSSINHSYDSNRTNKIISGIITVLQWSLHRWALWAQHFSTH